MPDMLYYDLAVARFICIDSTHATVFKGAPKAF